MSERIYETFTRLEMQETAAERSAVRTGQPPELA